MFLACGNQIDYFVTVWILSVVTGWSRDTEVHMFARVKKSGNYQYVQVVHNERIDGRVRQRVIATLGRTQGDRTTRRLARIAGEV